MKFGRIAITEATGAILAHTLVHASRTFKKGRTLTASDVATLSAAGIEAVTAARLEPGEVDEDLAAERVAHALSGADLLAMAPFTGRCNLYARRAGLLVYDAEALNRLNLVDEAITVATAPPYAVVEPRQLVATIKIIPYGIAEATVRTVERSAAEVGLRVAAFAARRVGLVQTETAGLRGSVLDKTRTTIEARIARYGSTLAAERRCAHAEEAIAATLRALDAEQPCDVYLIAGASATADRRDVVPAGIVRAGGAIVHMGMPVEPGNLLLLAALADQRPVVCLPGCARSPALNGFDWVLERLLAGVPVSRADIMRMGAGGLLKGAGAGRKPGREARPEEEPGAPVERAPNVAALVLAAGMSTRMHGRNKLLELVGGEPMIRRTVRSVLASQARPVHVVLGHGSQAIRECLAGLDVAFVDNPEYATGMASSIRRGIESLPQNVDALLVCLGDMPWVSAHDVERLIAAFSPDDGRLICVPFRGGQRGNPLLWARRYFTELRTLTGDVGARTLLERHAEAVCDVTFDSDSILRDIDTPEALAVAPA